MDDGVEYHFRIRQTGTMVSSHVGVYIGSQNSEGCHMSFLILSNLSLLPSTMLETKDQIYPSKNVFCVGHWFREPALKCHRIRSATSNIQFVIF